MNYRERVGRNIKYYRTENNLTLKEVATRMGMTESAIQKYEAGSVKRVDIEKIEEIAKAIGTTAENLTGWLSTEEKAEAHQERIAKRKDNFDSSFEGLSFDDQKQVNKYIKLLKSGSKDTPYLISNTEKDLIDMYRQLDAHGKEKLFDAVDDMLCSGKYSRKSSESEMVEGETQSA